MGQVSSFTGTYTLNFSQTRISTVASSALNIQAADFSLSGIFPCDGAFQASEANGIATVIINPNLSVKELAPNSPTCPTVRENTITLVYQGQTYTNVGLALSFVGSKAVVANGNACCFETYDFFTGTVTGVAFSMTGVVTVYSTTSGSTSQPIFSIPISGVGTFSSSAEGDGLGSDSVGSHEYATYQFAPSHAGLSTDTITQGNWNGVYGGDGYIIPDGPSYLPSYAAASVSQASTYTWASQSSDVRVLQSVSNATTGAASAYSANNFDVNITFTDSYIHRVSLYLLDFDTTSRSEVLTVTDLRTGIVLGSETLADFHNGVWASFDLQGSVTIDITSNGGGSAVVSGIFFGPGGVVGNTGPAISSPIFYGSDSTTKGAWIGRYGTDGYMIADGPSSAPSTGSINVAGAIPFLWARQTSDTRALQIPPGSSLGISSAFTQYPSSGFSINVHVNNSGEKLTLYFLDWDNEGRSERVTVTDLSTGTVLNTQTISNFQDGLYVSWLLGFVGGTGDVVFTIQPIGATTAAVSGIFFN